MITATLKLYGGIADPFDIDTVTSRQVSNFIDDNKDAEQLIVRINSPGGDVQEGWAIHDLLTTSGKKIKTIGEGKIYSIATIIFLAGEEREVMKNADGLIHNPFIPPYTLADSYESDDLEKIAESLKQEEAKILNFYAERTGTDKSRLAEYMKEDTKLSADDLLSLGFATKIIEPIKAYAYINHKNKIKMVDEKKFFEKLGGVLDKFADKVKNFSRLPVENLVMKDKEGNEISVERESGEATVGDKASPDGTFELEDGRTITITDGVITEIADKPEEEDEMNKKIATLQAELDAREAELTEAKEKLETVTAEASAREAEAKGIYDELLALKNTWKPAARQKTGQVSAGKVGIDLDRAREIREKLIK